MELKQLRYVLLVAEEKSLLSASKRGFISHQALSKIIQSLEQELKVTLFVRSRSGVELTSDGRRLLESASRIVSEVDALIADFDKSGKPDCERLRFGVTNGLLELLPIDPVSGFERLHPEWKLVFSEGDDRTIEQNVLNGSLNFGYVSGLSGSPALDFQLVVQSKTLLAMHQENVLAKKSSVRLSDLAGQVFLDASSNYYAHEIFCNACRAVGVEPTIGHRTTNKSIVIRLLEMNKGIFACAQDTVSSFVRPSIVVRSIDDDPCSFRLYLISKKGVKLSPAVRAFTDFFIGVTGQHDHSYQATDLVGNIDFADNSNQAEQATIFESEA
jgi:DNA-binding transcriptional LysR family regulator